MTELLRVVLRGESCAVTAIVGSLARPGHVGGTLICDLKPGHTGPLHYDNTDKIWWSADA